MSLGEGYRNFHIIFHKELHSKSKYTLTTIPSFSQYRMLGTAYMTASSQVDHSHGYHHYRNG